MYYLDIVNLFDVIESVETTEKTVQVKGLKDGKPFVYNQSYGYLKVAKEVSKRLKYFIGIKKN
jgi:hypothetical protein